MRSQLCPFFLILIYMLISGCSQTKSVTEKKPLLKKEGDWAMVIKSKEVYQIKSIQNGEAVVYRIDPSTAKEGIEVKHSYKMNELNLLSCTISEDSLCILNVEDNNNKLLLLYKGDFVDYKDSIHQETYAFDQVKLPFTAYQKDGSHNAYLRSLNGKLGHSNFLHTGRGKFVSFQNILNLVDKIERKNFKKRKEMFPYASTITWRDHEGKIQKAFTTNPQMETDSLSVYSYSNLESGKRINFNILPEDFDFIDNNTPSIQDTLRLLVNTTWAVPNVMFDYQSEECSKLLLEKEQVISINHEKTTSDIQFFSFPNHIEIIKQSIKYRYKAKMGYKGNWRLENGKLYLMLEGGGSYTDVEKKTQIRTKWKHELVFKILNASKEEIKLKTLSTSSEKLKNDY